MSIDKDLEIKTTVWSPAGFSIRGFAWFIDSILLTIAMSPVADRFKEYSEEYWFRATGIYLLLWGIYGALCNLWLQGSIGKKILGMKIVDAHDGAPVSFWVMFFRDGFGRIILSTVTLGAGLVWAAFNREKKSLHDHIFATRVVKKVPVAIYGETEAEPARERSETL